MDSSSSSDEEDLEKLREATATEFINDEMFRGYKGCKEPIDDRPKLPSLRPIKDNQEQFNLLDVTPEFQKFVAKRLGEHLEKELQKRLTSSMQYKTRKKRKKSGVRLFKDSKVFLSVKSEGGEDSNRNKVEIKRRTVENEEKISEDIKVKLCAVNSDDVLRKRGTEFWTERRKGEVFVYRSDKNGQLVCVEKEFV